MNIDTNTVMTIALGVFLALLARDALHAALSRLFGAGAMKSSSAIVSEKAVTASRQGG